LERTAAKPIATTRPSETYGCVAHVLKGENLHDFAAQVGEVEACRQIQWAIDRGYRISLDAQEYLNFRKTALPPAEAAAADEATRGDGDAIRSDSATASATAVVTAETPASPAGDNGSDQAGAEVVALPTAAPSSAATAPSRLPLINLAQQLGDHLKPTIVSAMPRVGKGMLIAYAWRYAKLAHPGLEVWVIDPKAHSSESGYWAGVDRIWRKPIDRYPVNDADIASEIEQFIEEWRQSPTRPNC
jgi:hypothetical protein